MDLTKLNSVATNPLFCSLRKQKIIKSIVLLTFFSIKVILYPETRMIDWSIFVK